MAIVGVGRRVHARPLLGWCAGCIHSHCWGGVRGACMALAGVWRSVMGARTGAARGQGGIGWGGG